MNFFDFMLSGFLYNTYIHFCNRQTINPHDNEETTAANIYDLPLFGRTSVEQNSAKFSFNIAHKSLSSFGLSNRGARDLRCYTIITVIVTNI